MADRTKVESGELLTVVETAARLFVTERTVRNWMNQNELPFESNAKGRMLAWRTTLQWFVAYSAEEAEKPKKRASSEPEPEVLETYEAALSRKTRAEADLKELQLAKARGEVAAIGDVERVLAASNLAVQTQVLAVPSRLASQMLGLEDHGRAVAILEGEMRQILTNLASIDAVREATGTEDDSE